MLKEVIDLGTLHNYRTEIPNIIDDLGLDPYEYRVYCKYKRIAGDRGQCIKSNKALAIECGMSLNKFKETKKALSQERKELGGKSLITINDRFSSHGFQISSSIIINDIWEENFLHYKKIKEKIKEATIKPPQGIKDKGGGHEKAGGGSTESHHEEDPIKKSNVYKVLSEQSPDDTLSPTKIKTSTEALSLAKALRDSILSWKKSLIKSSTPEKWSKDIEMLLRIDGQKAEEVLEVIEWLKHSPTHSNGFCWRSNILSGSKFREKFDMIHAEMMKPEINEGYRSDSCVKHI